jgi:uracil-DNA glycosylase family 4
MQCNKCEKLLKEIPVSQEFGIREYRNCMMGCGNKSAKLMVVGEALGKEEAMRGKPFVGQSGQLLRNDLLIEQGINPTELYISNAVKCRPLENRTPTAGEVENCREYLVNEIKAVKPRVILALGTTALSSLTNLTGITRLIGKVLYSYEFCCYIVPCSHPSYLLRLQHDRRANDLDLKDALEAVRIAWALTKKPVPQPPSTITELIDGQDAAAVTRMKAALMDDSGVLAYDIETTGLDYFTDALRGIAFTVDDNHAYFVTESVVTAEKAYFQKLFATRKQIIVHNAAFDMRMMKRWGFIMDKARWRDTMLMHHLADENQGHSLDTLSFLYTRFGGYKARLAKKRTKKVYAEIDIKQLAEYACLDVLTTWALHYKLEALGLSEGWLKLYDDIVAPTRKVLNDMSDTGLPISRTYLKKLDKKMKHDVEIVESVLFDMAERRGVKEFNVRSTAQLGNMLYDLLKLPCKKYTKKDARSTDEDALRAIEHLHPFPQILMLHRRLTKLHDTYVTGTFERLREGDDTLYTEYLSHGTVTGRLSSRNPNLQNIPRDKDVRRFIAAPKGWKLIEVDGSQIEVRFLGEYTGEKFLIDAFKRGADIHGEVTKEILGRADYTKEERSCFKQVVFGISYGMEAEALAEKLTEITKRPYTVEEAESYRKAFFDRMKSVPKWIADTVQLARRQGYVADMFGKRRRIRNVQSGVEYYRAEAERQVINSIIQGSASYCTNAALVRIAKRLPKVSTAARLVLTVHDSIVALAPDADAEAVKDMMIAEFEAVGKQLKMKVPTKADGEIVRAWGETKDSAGLVYSDIGEQVDTILKSFRVKKQAKRGKRSAT